MTTLLDFKSYPLWIDIMVFAVSAAVVWFAGTQVSRYADTIAERTGIGHATIGLLLLGGITSLPEVAVTVTSSLSGNAALAVNNLLGGVAMQVAILAVADAAIGRDALTSVIPDPIVLLQGTLNVLLLTLVASAIVVGEIPFLGIGGWSWSVLTLYLVSIWMIARSQGRYPWHPGGKGWHQHLEEQRPSVHEHEGRRKSDDDHKPPLGRTITRTIAAGAAILVAGFLLSRTGEAIAVKTGLGSSFVGAVFVAISTSLPEISTVLAAIHLRRYLMAVSDIFGTNLFDVGLVFLADATYAGGPVLNEVGRFSSFAALAGIVVTTLYIVGLIERRNRTILRMGVDSLVVLVAYLGSLILLYQLR